jgi:hypothetical protein
MVCITPCHPLYTPSPAKQDWLLIASEFETRWNFRNCAGAVDGTLVTRALLILDLTSSITNKPSRSFLLAMVDANYSLVVIDVGGYGKQSNGGTLALSELGMCFSSHRLHLPDTKVPTGSQTLLPHVFVAN